MQEHNHMTPYGLLMMSVGIVKGIALAVSGMKPDDINAWANALSLAILGIGGAVIFLVGKKGERDREEREKEAESNRKIRLADEEAFKDSLQTKLNETQSKLDLATAEAKDLHKKLNDALEIAVHAKQEREELKEELLSIKSAAQQLSCTRPTADGLARCRAEDRMEV